MSDKEKVVAIVQARFSSSRLPGKVMKKILGKPMLLLELERLQRCQMIDEIILATSIDDSDTQLAKAVKDAGFMVYQGNLNDVLDRYYQCAKQYSPAHIVRITGDCPLIEPQVVDVVISRHLEDDNDYTSNTLRRVTFPDGLDTEVMKFTVLERAWREAKLASEREHVTQYIIKHPDIFKQGAVYCDIANLDSERWTVDEIGDYLFVREVYERLYPDNPKFTFKDVLLLLQEYPEICELNKGITRNEGLIKSLKEDKVAKG